MNHKRFPIAILLLLFFTLVYYVGVKAWLFTCLVLFSLALREFIAFTKQKSSLNYIILQLILIAFIIFPYIITNHLSVDYSLSSFSASLCLFSFLILIFFLGPVLRRCKKKFKKKRKLSFKNLLKINFLFLLYAGFLPAHVFYLLAMDRNLLLLSLLTAISSDSSAYIFGKIFGRKQLLPKTSPGKTVEGALAGLVLALLVFTLLYLIFTNKFYLLYSWRLLIVLLFAALVACSAQLGDYYESLLKRCFRIKNSGEILASHGGILDRIDSHCLTIPITYIVLVVFHHLNL